MVEYKLVKFSKLYLMRYFLPIFSIIFCFNFALSQVELVLETDQYHHNLHDFLYNTQSNLNGEFQQTDEKIFLRINSQEMVYVDEENQQLSLAVELSNSYIHKQINAFDLGVYYIAHNNDTLKICMIDNNLINHEFISHDHNMSMWSSNNRFFFQKIEDNLFYYIKNNRQRFFKFNTETKETTELVNYFNNNDIEIHHYGNEGIFYSSTYNQNKTLYYINSSGEIEQFYESGNPIESVSWIENNDPDNFYISFKYENNVDSVFRINYQTLNKFLFSTASISSLHFNQNRVLGTYFHSNNFLGKIENDTLVIEHAPIPISNKFPIISNYYRPKLMDTEHEIFSYPTLEFGLELFTVNEQDSIDIIKDLNQGIGHSIPFGYCEQIVNQSNRVIKHDGETYFNMTNGNDNGVYLYKISKDSLEPVLRLKDYNPTRIRYFSFNENLYYFVYNSEVNKNRLYKIKWSDMNDIQSSEIEFNSNTWTTETSFKIQNRICYTSGWTNITPLDLIADKQNNIFIKSAAIDSYSGSWLFDRRNKKEISTNLCNAYHKYDKYGRLEWMKTIGGTYKSGFTMYDKFALDKDNNLQVYGVFFKKAYFDDDSLESVGSARFYAKINGETGEVLDKKTLYETDYTDDTRFDALIKGEDNFFYMVGSYRNFNQNFGDTTLISTWNHQNFLAKYDDNGNLIWIRNILNNWNDVIGEINNIEYSIENNEIMVFCSQNRTWCNDGSWKGEMIFYDINGKEKIRKGIYGWDRHTISKATALDSRYYIIKGSIKESLQAGVYETKVVSSESCNDTYDYQIVYDRQQNTFTSAVISDSVKGMNIKRVFQNEDYIYYCGNRVSNKDIVIQRFDKEGSYQGEKVLNQQEELRILDFAYRDGYFVLIMRDAKQDSFLKVNPIFGDVRNVMNIIRFEVNDWDYLQSYKPMDIEFIEYENVTLFAYPNPTYGKVQINFKNENFETYRVLSTSGQLIYQGKVPTQNFLELDLSNYENGLYFIQFEGGGKREVVKVIKQP